MSDSKIDDKMNEDDCIIEKNGKLWCNLCKSIVVGGKKSIKQHLKSITHKKALKSPKTTVEDNHVEEDSKDDNTECMLCDVTGQECVHPFSTNISDHIEWPTDPSIHVCLPPPLAPSPSRSLAHPFVTLEGGSLPVPPDNIEVVLENYCVGGPTDRLPNIDINLIPQSIKSFHTASQILQEAHDRKATYWAAFVIDRQIKNPKWWPKDETIAVPGYTQIIVGSGPTDIGIHRDVYGPNKVPVDTYFTMVKGEKIVIMLPPSSDLDAIFDGLVDWKSDCDEKSQECDTENKPTTKPKKKKSNFPSKPSQELLTRIHKAGGYYFRIKPSAARRKKGQQVTLFVPKGWHHWLLGLSSWAVIFGASCF